MQRRHLSLLVLGSILAACESTPPPVAPAPPPPPAAVAVTPPAAAAAPPAEPTAEESKKAKEAKQLAEDRAKWEAENRAEAARWTPEMHAAAKALAGKAYPNAKSAIQAAMAGRHRKPGATDRDRFRHPLEMLTFFGFKPTMTVLDIGPGEGWYTELLAPSVAMQGKYLATSPDPAGPTDSRATFYAQRWRALLDRAPELYGKVQTLLVDGKAPKLGIDDGTVDMILILRGVHGMHNNGTFGTWLGEVRRVLKPGGVLGIEEHRAPPDANPDESAKRGYVPEKWVIQKVEAAGFKLAGKSEINANPKDTKDYPEGVWTLPPTYRLKERDHDKYAAIGESDRMTLKFVKVAPNAPAGPNRGR
jgi:predicted methyltransferase